MRWTDVGLLVALSFAAGSRLTPVAQAADAPADTLAEPLRLADQFPLGLRVPASPLVVQGLAWLASVQEPDGRWRSRRGPMGRDAYDPGVTGLALAAFLGAGYGPKDASPHGAVVTKGLDYLKRIQDGEGRFGPHENQRWVYNQAYATLAMVEAFAETGDETYRVSAGRGVEVIRSHRNPSFGWRYGAKPGDNDTSVTGSMIVALAATRAVDAAARKVGVEPLTGPLTEEFEGALSWIDKMTEPDLGLVGYQIRGDGPSRIEGLEGRFPAGRSVAPTAIGLVVRAWSGQRSDEPKVAMGRARLSNHGPYMATEWRDFYYWFFGSTALYLLSPADWKKWSAELETALKELMAMPPKDRQVVDDPWAREGGAVYAMSFALLALESPYRLVRDESTFEAAIPLVRDPRLAPEFRAKALIALATHPQKGSLTALKGALSATDEGVRRAAVRALGMLRTNDAVAVDVVALLGPVLKDASTDTRVAAAHALGSTRRAIAVPALLAAAKQEASAVRAAAVLALARAGHASAAKVVPALVEALADADPAPRIAAARGLGALGAAAKESLPALERAAQDPDERVRAAASDASARVQGLAPTVVAAGPAAPAAKPATPPTAAELAQGLVDPKTRNKAADALRALGASAVGEIAPMATHADARVRRSAVLLLADVAPDAPEVVAMLLPGLSDDDASVREAALEGLAKAKTPSPDARSAIVGALSDPDLSVVAVALSILDRIAPDRVPAEPDLIRYLQDGSDALRDRAAKFLERSETVSDAAVNALVARVLEPGSAASACVRALAALAPRHPRVLAALEPLLRDRDAAYRGVWKIFEDAGEKGAPALARQAHSSDLTVQLLAERALKRMGPKAANGLPELVKALAKRSSIFAADGLIDVFRAIGAPSLDALSGALTDDTRRVRSHAALALGRMGRDARPALQALLKARLYERDKVVRNDMDTAVTWIQDASK